MDALYEKHNELVVAETLAGWVFTHAGFLLLGSAISLDLYFFPGRLKFAIFLIIFFALFFWLLRPLSARMGKRVLRLYQLPEKTEWLDHNLLIPDPDDGRRSP